MIESPNDKEKDSGLALVLIFLILFLIFAKEGFIVCAILAVLCDMLFPVVFKPFAWAWFGLGKVISCVTSKILLTIVYILIVTPVAFVRKILKKDSLMLHKWKQGTDSVLKIRNGEICPENMKYQF